MNEPLLSIVVPVYNTARYLRRCLEGILLQACAGVEVILVDDGSTDGSGEICDEYGHSPGLVSVIHQHNAGVSVARNAGIEKSHGRYLWFCDSDDRVLPDAIGRLLEAIGAGDDCPDVIAFPVVQEDGDGNRLGLIPAPEGSGYGVRGPLQSGDLLYPYAHVLRRSLVGSERFDTGLSLLEDRDFLYRVCSKVKGDIRVIEEPLYAYFITRQSSAVNSLPVDKYVAANDVQYRILDRELELGRPEPAYTIAARHTLGVLSLIAKTGKCKKSFAPMRNRLLLYDSYSGDLGGTASLKYRVCHYAPDIYRIVYSIIGRFRKSQGPGETVLVKP